MQQKPADERKWAHLEAEVRRDFLAAYYDDKNKTVATGSQCALALGLYFGLVPDSDRDAVLGALVRNLEERQYRQSTGEVSFRFLVPALAQAGRSDVVYRMIRRTDAPGYGCMLEQHGLKTLSERWDRPGSSLNHCMFGHIQEWFQQYLLGIRQAPGSVGFEKVLIDPFFPDDLDWAKGSFDSPNGRIEVAWTRKGAVVEVAVESEKAEVVVAKEREGVRWKIRGGAKTVTEEPPRMSTVRFRFDKVAGIGAQAGVCRRDPSDVIEVGGTYYVWYSRTTGDRKLYPSGYNATVWFATSDDEGRTWTEQGEAIGLRDEGFDSFGVFTPNILAAQGKYYLFYTAVAAGFTNTGYADSGRTAIGLAVADSAAGPWQLLDDPVLESTRDPRKFDSYRVDDACLVVRDGRYWLYYKGRRWQGTPRQTRMGVAVASHPTGPYKRMNDGDSVQDSGHEVLVWPERGGVMSLVSATGPNGRTLQYARDGLAFRVIGRLARDYPRAPGVFRTDLSRAGAESEGVRWGISMVHGRDPYLVRWSLDTP